MQSEASGLTFEKPSGQRTEAGSGLLGEAIDIAQSGEPGNPIRLKCVLRLRENAQFATLQEVKCFVPFHLDPDWTAGRMKKRNKTSAYGSLGAVC